MEATLSDRLERTCKAFANATAFLEAGVTPVSYSNFFMAILRFAERLTDVGVKPGDHVVVATREQISVTAMKLALIRIGAVPIAVSPAVARQHGPVRVDHVVLPRSSCSGHPNEIPFDQSWITPPTRYTPITAGGRIIHATSGTTGVPKLRNDSEQTFFARIQNGLVARGPLDGPVFVAHNVGSLIGLKSVLTGLLETQCVMPMMGSPEETVRGIEKNSIVYAYIPPLHLKRLVDAAEAIGATTPDLRRINVGGGSISGQFAERCEQTFGCEIYTDYGSTETDTIACYRASRTQGTPGLVGPIWDLFNFRFQSLTGEDADPDEGGELFLQVPEMMRTENYPDETPLFDADGWISTGDIGHLTAEGHLVLSGRKSELINVGGNKISPLSVEAAALGFPGLNDVAAFRVPTDSGIDAIGLGIVVGEGFDLAQFRSFLQSALSDLYSFRILNLPSIPQSETGKTDRKALVQALEDQVSSKS